MQKKYLVLCLASVLPFGFAASALAQSANPAAPAVAAPYQLSGTSISGASSATSVILTTPVAPTAAAYKTESGIYLYPNAFLGSGRNDNVLSTNTDQISSNFLRFEPQLVAEFKNKGDRYTALAWLAGTRYADIAEENVTNSEFKVAGDNYFSSRARAGWSIGRIDNADARGATKRSLSTTPDRWHANSLDARLIYGAPEAPGRFEVDLARQVKAYENNRDVTTLGDLTLNSFAGRGFYRLGTRTLALAEFRQAKANYASAVSTDSNTERRYYAGVTWEATAATTGIVKLGRMTKDFDLASRPSYSGGSWEATARWAPRTYSVFDLTTGRATADATGFGNYTLNTSTDLVWNHAWTQSLNSRVAVGSLSTDFVGTARTDRATNYALTVDYAVLRWLKIGADFARTDNASNDASAAYKRNIIMLTLNASL